MNTTQSTKPDSRIVDDLDIAAVRAERGLEMDALDEALADAERSDLGLDALWQIPPDLEDRITQGVRRRLRNRHTAWLVGDLMGLGWSTTKAMIEPDAHNPHGR